MFRAGARIPWRRCAAALVAVAIAILTPHDSTLAAQDEVRALWVVRTSLTSRAAIDTMVSAARASGFNALLVQIRGRADAYYAGGLEPRAATLSAQPAFDPLADVLARAHEAGLQVHAWINVNLVAGVNELPSAREHVVYRHPEWLMVPRVLAEDLAAVDAHSPEYLGRLARYVRSQPGELEGLYLSPMSQTAADYSVAVTRDIVSRYAVDGVHLDYVRYPNDEFDYSRGALAAFRDEIVRALAPAEAQRYDARLAREPMAYAQAFPERWRAFRTARLSALVERLHDVVKTARPSAVVSAAVIPDAADAAVRRLQDWGAWTNRGLVDVVCPMAYTTDASLFASQITAVRDLVGRRATWAGIGAYRLSADQIVENVQAARRLGAGGIVLYSYDSLAAPSRGPGYLTQVARAAFTSQ